MEKKEKLKSLKVSEQIHSRVYFLIYPQEGKRSFKSADDVLRFLFQQYDEKMKDKLNSIRNKDSNCILKIPLQAMDDAGLKSGDALDISVEGNRIILEKKDLNSSSKLLIHNGKEG